MRRRSGSKTGKLSAAQGLATKANVFFMELRPGGNAGVGGDAAVHLVEGSLAEQVDQLRTWSSQRENICRGLPAHRQPT